MFAATMFKDRSQTGRISTARSVYYLCLGLLHPFCLENSKNLARSYMERK